MVFMTMGNTDSSHLILIFNKVGHIRDNDIHAVQIFSREGQTSIQYNDVIFVLEDGHIFTDFTETTQRDNHQLTLWIQRFDFWIHRLLGADVLAIAVAILAPIAGIATSPIRAIVRMTKTAPLVVSISVIITRAAVISLAFPLLPLVLSRTTMSRLSLMSLSISPLTLWTTRTMISGTATLTGFPFLWGLCSLRHLYFLFCFHEFPPIYIHIVLVFDLQPKQ